MHGSEWSKKGAKWQAKSLAALKELYGASQGDLGGNPQKDSPEPRKLSREQRQRLKIDASRKANTENAT